MSKKQKAIIYLRTANPGQHRKDKCPLRIQERKCRKYCKKERLEVIKTFKEVAMAKLSKQPELLKAIAYCQENNIGFIIADNFSRFSRELSSYKIIKKMCGGEVKLQTTAKPIGNIAEYNLLEAINFSFATYESDMQRMKSRLGQRCICQSQ